jgi:hypothetical protein
MFDIYVCRTYTLIKCNGCHTLYSNGLISFSFSNETKLTHLSRLRKTFSCYIYAWIDEEKKGNTTWFDVLLINTMYIQLVELKSTEKKRSVCMPVIVLVLSTIWREKINFDLRNRLFEQNKWFVKHSIRSIVELFSLLQQQNSMINELEIEFNKSFLSVDNSCCSSSSKSMETHCLEQTTANINRSMFNPIWSSCEKKFDFDNKMIEWFNKKNNENVFYFTRV